MSRPARPIFPRTRAQAVALGERLRLARGRRGMTETAMAERVGCSRMTLYRLERGELSVSLSILFRVLDVLSLAEDVDRIAAQDDLGTRIRDARMPRPRASSAPNRAEEL
jgi:transcriptional regulator with XRE-family HTH domain